LNVVATIKDDHYTVMPLFVLALVSKGGLNTLYTLQHQAGLQPGGVQPVLRQLEKEGLLQRSAEGKRRRRVMVVTDKGKETLAAYWRSCLGFYMDVESVLRAATTSLLMCDPREAYCYLRSIAADYERKSTGPNKAIPDYRGSLMDWYGFMRSEWETARLQSAAQTLRMIANTIDGSAEFLPTKSLLPSDGRVEGNERQVRIRSERAP
jgi:DNA-binding MarR family transcriptional regulator